MKILALFLCVVSIYGDEQFWYPIDNFLDGLANKTKEINNFMEDQKSIFIENINNGTKTVQDILETQHNKIKENLESYEENIKKNNDEVIVYFKNTSERLENNFKSYVQYPPTELWSVFTKSEDEEKMSNREAELSTPAMIVANGYPCESHTVVTSDGYILTVHRISKSPNEISSDKSKTVFLQHGLFASSADWVFAGTKRSLAYLLSDAGYDVWMGNVRGNRYSREHVTWKIDTVRYWNFSWHEIATRDLPAVIDYIHEMKGPETKITYIGHSMGTTLLFALLSSKPEYNGKLKAGFALAPVVFMSDVRGPARGFAPYSHNLGYVSTILGRKEFMQKQPGHGWLGSDACDTQMQDSDTCKNFIFMLCGFDDEQLDRSMLPVFLAHIGSGTSVKTLVHFSQEIYSNGRFQMFDYGIIENVKAYGTSTPPDYDVGSITLPIALFSSKNDPLSSETDVLRLYDKLTGKKEIYSVPFAQFNHLDFLWAKDIKQLLHEKLIQLLNDWNTKFFKFVLNWHNTGLLP